MAVGSILAPPQLLLLVWLAGRHQLLLAGTEIGQSLTNFSQPKVSMQWQEGGKSVIDGKHMEWGRWHSENGVNGLWMSCRGGCKAGLLGWSSPFVVGRN